MTIQKRAVMVVLSIDMVLMTESAIGEVGSTGSIFELGISG